MVNVVLFSGGRGSDVLSRQLVGHPDVVLTIAINGYDDGASTGEVRRFLGDSLGPSDFRKNASRVARETRSCPDAIVEVLDTRLPNPCTRDIALRRVRDGDQSTLPPPLHVRIDVCGSNVGEGCTQPVGDASGRLGCRVGVCVGHCVSVEVHRPFVHCIRSHNGRHYP